MLVAGGNAEYCANAMTPGGSKSWVFDASPGANHTLIEEQTAFPRVVRYAFMMNQLTSASMSSSVHQGPSVSMHELLLICDVTARNFYCST